MSLPTPFHSRTAELCHSLKWTDWAGYAAVCAYNLPPEAEYFALRHTAGLIDVTPLYKYEIFGPEALPFLGRVLAREAAKVKVGQVAYCCWCDDEGKVIDDGTLFRLSEDHLRLIAAEPSWAWLKRYTRGFEVTIEDSTSRLAALALQGPTSGQILKQVSDIDLDSLGYFQATTGRLDSLEVYLSRTGYTGDLGYEIWVENKDALALWDALVAAGRPYGLQLAGLDALDVTRIEAGFILNGVDYFSAHHCLTESQKSTPFELGLGWTLDLDREPFIGQQALKAEKARGSGYALVGLEIDWPETAALYEKHGLPAQVPAQAWRTGVPVYDRRCRQIGKATSGVWSPIIKKNLALATIKAPYAEMGAKIKIEYTVEYQRSKVGAVVTPMPFYDPVQRKA